MRTFKSGILRVVRTRRGDGAAIDWRVYSLSVWCCRWHPGHVLPGCTCGLASSKRAILSTVGGEMFQDCSRSCSVCRMMIET